MDETKTISTLHVCGPVVTIMLEYEEGMKVQKPPQIRMDCMTR